jgi:hypothetical protein
VARGVRARHGNVGREPCSFQLVGRVGVDKVLSLYSDLYAAGHHEGERPDVQLDILRGHGADWVLAGVPLWALDYQTVEESGEARVARARAYAARRGAFPPGIAVYGGRSQRRRTGRGYVVDGNHRVLAATLRGDCAVRMFMPAGDYERLVEDAALKR